MEKPILFNAEMVRAILSGQKTQTRRPVKPQPNEAWAKPPLYIEDGRWASNGCISDLKCPFGKVGDELYVRETFARYQTVNGVVRSGGRSFSEVSDGQCLYRADGYESIEDAKEHIRLMSDSSFEAVEIDGDKWTPSIHMPRWASRIQLKVKRVWVERVNDITREDAVKEGVCYPDGSIKPKWIQGNHWPEENFKTLWNSIYKNWNENPYVWACEFERI